MYRLIKATRPERAKALIINALALSGRTNDNTIIPRVSLRFALGYALVGLSDACKTQWSPGRYHALCAYTPSGRMFTHLMDEPFYERMSMFFVFLGVFLVRMSTKRGEGVLHV